VDVVTDLDIQAAIDRAIEQLARRLAAVAPLQDPAAAARSFLDELMDGPDRWRPIPPGPGWVDPKRRNPAVYERGAAEARARLHNTTREDDTP
jgi:hypothetical protein